MCWPTGRSWLSARAAGAGLAGPELNALTVGLDGRILRRGCPGDGIGHLQVAEDGTIWAGYSDEGVYGNFGRRGPGPTPLGARGMPSLRSYLQRDLEHEWGSASFAAAALERLGAVQADVAVSDRDRSDLDHMLTVARHLAEGSPCS